MSDDLRRAYLLGDGHSLYGNLPGENPELLHSSDATFGHAFAAIPRPFEQNDSWNHGRPGARPPFMSNRPVKPDGGLNLQEKTWSGATYMLAPCPRITDSQDVKSLVLEHAIESIRSGNGKWRNKTDCSVNHFNQVLILTSATLTITDFDRFDSGLYDYRFLNVQTSAYRPLNIPADGANQNNFRGTVRYVSVEMTIDARRQYADPGQPGAHLYPGPDTKVVLFRLPIGPNGSLHDAITTAIIRDMRQLLVVCQYLQGSTQFGMLERDQFSQDKFGQWVEEIKQHTRFEIVAKLMRPAFVGEGIIETPVTRLVQCQQRVTNDKGQTTAATIDEHYARFTAIVQQLNAEEPYPINLPTTFFNSLTPHMQDKLNRRRYRHPPPSSNNDQIKQLKDLRNVAKEEEKEIETQIQLIKTTLHPSASRPPAYQQTAKPPYQGGRPIARTFMAHTGGMAGQDHDNMAPRATPVYTARTETGSQPAGGGHTDEDMLMEQFHLLQHYMSEGQHPTTTTAFLSPAETALRNASGTDRPIECWGCTGHTTLHSQRFHSFRDCPHKYDPDIRRVAFQRMKQMREEYETRRAREREQPTGTRKRDADAMLTKTEATQNWQELGFVSRHEAEKAADAVAMMTTNISARQRHIMNREWTRKWNDQPQELTRTPTEAIQHYYGPGPGTEHNPNADTYHFIAWAFQATPLRTTLPLEISPTLPHCHFPIGNAHGKGKLKIAVDSCAGVNIGHLQFHKCMAETFPELVASFKTMEEYGENAVTIGGVEVSATTLKLTHIIEYRTPFRYNGTACNLTFGLSEQAAATAIVSINFLRKTKALWSYDDAAPDLHLTIWNTTLTVHYEAPSRRPPPTPQDRFRNEATAVYTAGAVETKATVSTIE